MSSLQEVVASPSTSSVATKKSYKGGWLDKDLRRAAGRAVYSAKVAEGPPSGLSSVWTPLPQPPITSDGWVVSISGLNWFRVCFICGDWTGEAILDERSANYAKGPCRCL